jgi:hypothetical protein
MPTFKLFLTRASGQKVLDTYACSETPHVGDPLRLDTFGAVVTAVNPTPFVDQERGELDGVVYGAEVADAAAAPPMLEVPDQIPDASVPQPGDVDQPGAVPR